MRTRPRLRIPPRLGLALVATLLGLALFAVAFVASAAVTQRLAGPTATDPRGSAARAVRETTGTDRVISQLQERLRRRGPEPRALASLGLAYLQKARETGDPSYYPRAEAAFEQAYALAPDDADTLLGRGAVAMGRHQFEEALLWAEAAIAANEYKAAAYGLRGQALIELGRYAEAVESVQRMVDLRPDLASYGMVAYVRELHGDVAGAIEAMQQAVRLGVPGQENTEWSRVQLGHLYFHSGRLDEAAAAYQAALDAYPGYAYALAGLARVTAARGEYARAATLYQQALDRAPLLDAAVQLAELHEVAGPPAEAARAHGLVRVFAQLYAANGVDTDADLLLYQIDYGDDLARTLERAREAFARRPTIRAADALAWALYRAGDCAQAEPHAREALRLGTRDALLLFHAGQIAACTGDHPRATALLTDALTVNPYFSLRYAPVAREVLRAGTPR